MGLLFIRHGITSWNEQRRIQGRCDIPLSEHGRRELAGRRLPEPWCHGPVFSSPLTRALETAAALGAPDPDEVIALAEMRWGEWEGETLSALSVRLGARFADNAARGLDFRPPGGESPRDVRARLATWLATLPDDPTAAVFTHKGVIRAALSLATGWDMTQDYPDRIDYAAGHEFRWHAGHFTLVALNRSLEDGVR